MIFFTELVHVAHVSDIAVWALIIWSSGDFTSIIGCFVVSYVGYEAHLCFYVFHRFVGDDGFLQWFHALDFKVMGVFQVDERLKNAVTHP